MKLYKIDRLYAPEGAEGGTASEAGTTDAPSQEGDDDPNANSDADSKPEKQEPDEKPESELEFISKDDEGNFVIKTENSVYKGKTREDALKAFYEGKVADEQYIRQLKAKESVKLPENLRSKIVKPEAEDDSEPEMVLRTRDEIAQEVAPKILREFGVDQKKMSWTNQQWKDYQLEQGLEGWEIAEERANIREARKAFNDLVERIYSEETKRLAIAEVVDEEHEQVLSLVAESGVDPSHFNYEKVLEQVMADKNNFNRHGVLKSGRIVAAVMKELRSIEREKGRSAYQRKVEEDIAKGQRKKENVPGAGVGSGQYKSKPKAYDSLDDALDAAKSEYGLL